MSAVDTAKNLFKSAAEASVKKGREIYAEYGGDTSSAGNSGEPDPAGPVSLTILATPQAVRSLWTDAAGVARVLGDLATVTRSADGAFVWNAARMEGDITWTTQLIDDVDLIRFLRTDSADSDTEAVRLELSPAPNDLGTQVSLRLGLPIPDVVAKTAAFTLLYRTRALLQTGEIPTLRPLPAARPSNR